METKTCLRFWNSKTSLLFGNFIIKEYFSNNKMQAWDPYSKKILTHFKSQRQLHGRNRWSQPLFTSHTFSLSILESEIVALVSGIEKKNLFLVRIWKVKFLKYVFLLITLWKIIKNSKPLIPGCINPSRPMADKYYTSNIYISWHVRASYNKVINYNSNLAYTELLNWSF